MNMKTLGFDPGARFVAWAVLDGPRLLDRGCITGPIVKTKKNPAGVEWQRALASILGAVEMRFREVKPELVACEQTQHVAGKRAMSDESRMAQAVATDRTQQIIGGIAVLCERYQVPLVMVHPASSAAALGVKRGATDGEVSAAHGGYGRLWLTARHLRRDRGKRAAGTGAGLPARVPAKAQALSRLLGCVSAARQH